jgi:cysteine desulfurase
VVQPIAEAAEIVSSVDSILHVDAVQTAGRIPCNIKELGASLLTVSGHKLGGPQGSGALVMWSERFPLDEPLIKGGGQERGHRAGTENVAAIAGLGAAAQAAGATLAAESARIAALRERLETGLRELAPTTVIFGAGGERLPNTTLFAVPGLKAETALIALDLDGVSVSSGSACSSGKVAPSQVLAAMGVAPDLAGGAIRVSLGWETRENEVERFLIAWSKVVSRLSKGEKTGLAA